jgi:EAL domain-containing protein (putative c-di-GMP-specific phosphodiesterase class I)
VSDPNLLDTLNDVLGSTRLPASQLTLELTQGTIAQITESGHDMLRAIRRLGVHVCIDNFGIDWPDAAAGLDDAQFDRVKIDVSVIHALSDRERTTDRIRPIIGAARARRIRVSAIGVETEQQLSLLRDEDCRVMQGYLLGRPSPPAEFEMTFNGRASHKSWTSVQA